MDKKKRFVHVFVGYVIALVVITYISRTIYQWRLPRVALGFSESGNFDRSYEMLGTVMLSDEYPGYTAVSSFFIPKEELPLNFGSVGKVGDNLYLEIKGVENGYRDGKVLEIDYVEEGVWIKAGYDQSRQQGEETEIVGGEDILCIYRGISYYYDCIVPSSAIYWSGDESYIYTVYEDYGAMGRRFITSKMAVQVNDEYYGKSAIFVASVTIDDPIVFSSDTPLTKECAVRFYP